MAISPNLIGKIMWRAAEANGMTLAQFDQHRKEKFRKLDQRLTDQLESQRMTPEILEKGCTL